MIEMAIPAKSLLESVKYEKVLARRKEKETKFRNANFAELKLEENISKPEILIPEITSDECSIQVMKENVAPPSSNNTSSFISIKSTDALFTGRTGGGGEPVKDSLGNLITVRGSSDWNGHSSQPGVNFIDKKLSYREELKKQIEEKRKLEAAAREEARRLEEQMAQRAEEQRIQMLLEYENELKKNNFLKEQRQKERLKKLEEFQQKEIALKEKRAKERLMQQSKTPSKPLYIPGTERSSSPPVPSVRSKVIMERTTSPTVVKALSEVKSENLFSSLAEIRKSIMKDKNNLLNDSKGSYEVMNRRTVNDDFDDEDGAIK